MSGRESTPGEWTGDEWWKKLESERKRLERVCYIFLRDDDSAKDATQHVIVNAWNNRDTFLGKCSLSRWLYISARNHCLTRLNNRQVSIEDEQVKVQVESLESPECVEREAMDNIMVDQISKTLQEKNPLYQDIFRLWLNGLTWPQVGHKVGVHFERARDLFTRHIKPEAKKKMEEKSERLSKKDEQNSTDSSN